MTKSHPSRALPGVIGFAMAIAGLLTTAFNTAGAANPSGDVTSAGFGFVSHPVLAETTIETQNHSVLVTSFDLSDLIVPWTNARRKPAGYIDFLPGRLLLIGGDGGCFDLLLPNEASLRSTRRPCNLPALIDHYRYPSPKFSVKDLLVSGNEVFVTMLSRSESGTFPTAINPATNTDAGCFSLALAKAVLDDAVTGLDFEVVYETAPCVEFAQGLNAHLVGGRIIRLGSDELLMQVGTFLPDSEWHEPSPLRSRETDFGKTLIIEPRTGERDVFSVGHRNPQGLVMDPGGTLWATEHGPRGGDELNVIDRGAHYGWPDVTWGRHYDRSFPEGFQVHGDHRSPVFFWAPSIAPSEVRQYVGKAFEHWTGNLLVATLKDQSIRRLTIQGDRVLSDERMALGERIRDLAIDGNGWIYALTDSARLLLLRPE